VEAFCAGHAGVPVYLVRVVEDRPVSDYIAERTGVRHESPQVIVLRAGKVRWHASHGGVTGAAIAEHLE